MKEAVLLLLFLGTKGILCKPQTFPDGCPKFCHTIIKQVCGSDGETYVNECLLKARACLTKSDISVVETGKCNSQVEEGVKSARAPSKIGGNGFDISEKEYFAAAERCELGCGKILRPVCGTDRKYYDNECILKEVSCIKQEEIAVKHVGYCDSTPITENDRERCEHLDCAKIDRPVCGTDGRTYPNECELEKRGCLKLSDVTVESTGPCPRARSQEKEEDTEKEFEKRSSERECPGICPALYLPVCGSDGINILTYVNSCELRAEECSRGIAIEIIKDGQC